MTRFGLFFVLVSAVSASGTNGWVKDTEVDGNSVINFRLALFQQNLDKLEALFWAVSDPASPQYKKYMTTSQITDLVSPPLADIETLQQWLGCTHRAKYPHMHAINQTHGSVVCQLGVNADYMFVTMPASRAGSMFQLGPLFRYMHPHAPKHIRITRASPGLVVQVPEALRDIIHSIRGLTGFPPYARRVVRSTVGEPGADVTPQVIWKTYNIAGSPSRGSQSVAEFEDAEVQVTDVENFQKLYKLPNQKFDIIGPNNGGYFAECTLDVEFIMGVAPGVKTVMWSIQWTTFETDLLTWTQQVLAAKDAPLVHSISWGSGEHGYYKFDPATMKKTNTDFQKMGLRGMSVFSATGDDGTSHTGGPFKPCKRFDAYWPAVSPYLTAVGGTYIEETSNEEVGWVASGGGFSDFFPRPSYQEAVVKSYLANNKSGDLPPFSFYNTSGRAIPDISAVATNFQTVLSNITYPLSGTSAAAPTVAAIISRINDALLAGGKKPVGFVNPALYAMTNVGFDVLHGTNPSGKCPMGFRCAPGWDAVTGLGTPDYPSMLKYFTKSS